MLDLIASVLLGGVMSIAGASKVTMGKRWPIEADSMRAPRAVVPFLPWIEIVSGALLIAQWQSRIVAIIVAGLLVSFSALIAWNLAQGHRPHCACLGAWSTRPLGWRHLARNGVLIALAVVVVISP